MDPITALAIVGGIGVVGKTIGGIGQSLSTAKAYEDQAKAIEASTAAEVQAQKRRDQIILAKNQARTEAAGVSSLSGTPLAVDLDNAFNAGMNRAAIQYAGDVKRRAALRSAANAKGQIPGLIFSGITDAASIMGGWYKASTTPTTYAPGTYMYPNSPWGNP